MPVKNQLAEACRLALRLSDVAHGDVLLDAFGTTFAAEAGFLDATEWSGSVGDGGTVDSHHACLQRVRQVLRGVEVLGEGIGCQTELGVVGIGDSFLQGGEGGHGGYRPEDLLAQDLGG